MEESQNLERLLERLINVMEVNNRLMEEVQRNQPRAGGTNEDQRLLGQAVAEEAIRNIDENVAAILLTVQALHAEGPS